MTRGGLGLAALLILVSVVFENCSSFVATPSPVTRPSPQTSTSGGAPATTITGLPPSKTPLPILHAYNNFFTAPPLNQPYSFDATTASIPFSFVYGGQPFLNWQYQAPTNDPMTWSYIDPSGVLKVSVHMMIFNDNPNYSAVEWYLSFENIGQVLISAPISKVNVADLGFLNATGWAVVDSASGALGDSSSSDGSTATPTVSDFTPQQTVLAKNGSIGWSSSQGRSSSGRLPYFAIEQNGGGGVVLAIGWSGQWHAQFAVDATGTNMGFKAGQETFSAQLLPGESVRTPSVLAMPWAKGNRVAGQNYFRQLMQKHFYPKNADGTALKPIAAASNGALGHPWEANSASELISAINAVSASGLALNTWWADTGWYPVVTSAQNSSLYNQLLTSSADNLWLSGLGDWVADPARFASGYLPVSQAAANAGLKSLLWFEPERMSQPALNFSLYNNSGWLLADPVKALNDSIIFGLVDFSNPAISSTNAKTPGAMVSLIENQISRYQINIFRQDMNINQILKYWQNADAASSSSLGLQRAGLTEAKYIFGLYNFWDELRNHFPGLIIDNCASGGRRLDFEALSRTVALWRSDRVWDAVEQQEQMLGLSYWLPLQGRGSDPDGSQYPLQYKIRSGYGWSSAYAFNWLNLPADQLNLLKIETGALFGATSPLGPNTPLSEIFTGDYYPISYSQKAFPAVASAPPAGQSNGTIPDYTGSSSVWVGWQFDRPDLNAGLVQGFRRSTTAPAAFSYVLQGLNSAANYLVSDLDSPGVSTKYPGATLMATGLLLNCPSAPCAKVYTYLIAP